MSKIILKSLAVLGAIAISTSAHAAPFEIIDNGLTSYHTGWVTSSDPSVGPTNVRAGAFDLKAKSGPLDDFIAYCIDIQHTFSGSTTYEIVSGPTSLIPEITSSIANSVQALFNTSYSQVSDNLGTANLSAGFQLALWEVLFEENAGAWDLGAGNFKVTGFGGAVGAAGDMLAATWDYLDTGLKQDGYMNYDLTWLQAEVKGSKGQNLVTAVVSPIPLPAAGPMLLFGLAGLGYIARRRKQAEA